MKQRAAGILLHPSSLPGPYAIGDIGPSAYRFLDWLAQAGQSIWQVLPLGPTGAGYSPYAALSSFAGDPLLVSPELLERDGLLEQQGDPIGVSGGQNRIDHASATGQKQGLLRRSWDIFRRQDLGDLHEQFEIFRGADEQRGWLDDWCLFATFRAERHNHGWWTWPRELRDREGDALDRASSEHADEIAFHAYCQFLFHRQWNELRDRANELGIRLLGDLPIYAALDSADVWARPDLFDLDEERRPREVAGVPPDYFSEDGQLWGNPVYRWPVHIDEGFSWWIDRVASNLRLVDWLRIDHFRGFEAYWSVPVDHETARDGVWKEGPGMRIFDALGEALGELPLIAEDLGVITDAVRELRARSGLPGMRVLQFGFGENDSEHAPHRFGADTVAYTGTHDNDTLRGWFQVQDQATKRRILRYSGGRRRRIHWDLIRLLHTSSAGLAIVPVQDALGLGSEARMNVPGEAGGNWSFRLAQGTLSSRLARRLDRLTELSGRKIFPETKEN